MGKKWIEKNDAYYAINEKGRIDGSMCSWARMQSEIAFVPRAVACTSGLEMRLSYA